MNTIPTNGLCYKCNQDFPNNKMFSVRVTGVVEKIRLCEECIKKVLKKDEK